MNEVRCAHCNSSGLEMAVPLDDSMAVQCKQCEKGFKATELRGCPKCKAHNLRMIVEEGAAPVRCEECGSTFKLAELGDCPHCNSPELKFLTLVENVIVKCRQCGRTGTRGEMMRVVSSEPTAAPGSNCFIATAACGNDQAQDVVQLCLFREKVLRQTRLGCAVIAVYESVSPPLARLISRSEALRRLVRVLVVRPARYAAGRISAKCLTEIPKA